MASDILVVDDEADIRELVSDIVADRGYSVRTAACSDTALRAIAERVPSVIILDLWLRGSELDGMGVLELMSERHPEVPVIVISGHGNIESAVQAIKLGAIDFLEKPFKEEKLLHIVERGLEILRLRRENSELKRRMDGGNPLIGESVAVRQVRQMIGKVAPTGSRVLIQGAAGTGKEFVARLIHAQSARAKGPFIILNAAMLSPEQMSRELFGVEADHPGGGAAHVGVLERAHGGTLFIDEVADMPQQTQARFLRVLQSQSFERVGGSTPVDVDVRIISASSKDLQHEMAVGRFREDLFYRLNVVPLLVPPLSARREDIPDLCQFFLERSADSIGVVSRPLSQEALAVLQAYHWPGNVRQLRNVMEWLLIMSGDRQGEVGVNELPPEIVSGEGAAASNIVRLPHVEEMMALPLREARELFERHYLQQQMQRFGGNISRTSVFIGMERSALHRKLKTLGVVSALEKIPA